MFLTERGLLYFIFYIETFHSRRRGLTELPPLFVATLTRNP
jgi:hypothetical protein